MNKKIIFTFLGMLCFVAAFVMWSFRNDSRLSELGDFCWAPIPFGVACILIARKIKTNDKH